MTQHVNDEPVRIGVVGFGTGGLHFHAPFIEAASGVELAGVVTRNSDRRRILAERFPGVPAYDSLADLVAGERAGSGIDAVTLTTPPETRRDLVLEALRLGVHVVADKPFAASAEAGAELDAAGQRSGLVLGVFHNRRWDSDIQTLKAVMDSGELGTIRRFHSRFDLDQPGTLEAGPSGGLLRDLGSHLVDQALWLFGPASRVYARLDWVDTDQGRTDSGFVLTISHASGVDSHLSASKLNRFAERDLRLYGAGGSYVARGTDVQAQAVFAGVRPVDSPQTWGYEPESAWGVLATAEHRAPVPAQQGNYSAYYAAFAAAVRNGGPPPVSAAEAVAVLQVLDAARASDQAGQAAEVPSPPRQEG
jgi:predicted dehydrogenase